MAWTTPSNVTVGQLQTSAGWNAQVKENWDASFPDAVTVNSWNVILEATTTDPTVATDEGVEWTVGAIQFCWARFDDFSDNGDGTYFVTLPSTATGLIADTGNEGSLVGQVAVNDASGGGDEEGLVLLRTTTTVLFIDGAGVLFNGTDPITFTTDDTLTFDAAYPIA